MRSLDRKEVALPKVRSTGLVTVFVVVLGCTGKKENYTSQVNSTGETTATSTAGGLAIATAVVEGCLPVPGTPLPHLGSGRCNGNNQIDIPIRPDLGGGSLIYNSHSTLDTGFSRGWRYSGQIEIEQISSDLLAITLGDATRFEVSSTNGTFYSHHPLFRDVLILVQQDTVEAQFNNGTRWVFSKSTSGKFLAKDFIERDGSKASLEWNDDIISKITTADGDVINFSRSGSRVTGIQKTEKSRLVLSYDFANRLEKVRDFESNRFFSFKYGTNHLLLLMRSPDGGEEEFFYNPDGYLRGVLGANKFATHVIYTQNSVKITDESTFSTEKFQNGMVVEVNTDGIKTQIERNTSGFPTSVTDAIGNVTRFEYDSVGRLNRKTEQDGMVTSLIYDNRGRVIRQTRGRAGVVRESVSTYNDQGDVMSSMSNGAGYVYERNQKGLVTLPITKVTY
jgi:YD repeat-containing protein